MTTRSCLVLAGVLGIGLAAVAHADDGHGRRGPRYGARRAVVGEPYLLLRGGVFEPNDSDDGLKGYDSGWSVAAGIGSRLSPVFATEFLVGGYGASNGPNDVQVIPVTVGGRFIVPGPFLEPYLGGGFGVYFARLKEEAVWPDFSGIDDSSTTLGGYLSMGLDLWLSPRTALNLEGAYQFANASFDSNAGTTFDVDLGGWTLNVGVRLAF